MRKFIIKKENCYKINLPSENDIAEYINDCIDLNLFNSISPIVDGFFLDVELYGHLKLNEYVHKYNLDKDLLYFYENHKDVLIRKLSVKQKILLSISENLHYDCLLLSLEALSERTRLYLIFISYFLSSSKRKSTIILFEYSTLNRIYENIEITIIKPSWSETKLEY
ncbi:hypothetical protein SD427_12120 [Chryseobacterium sp. JJR-5R]|uniref:hypothetical protein n=1 Tax=Chryseobacterium sp. JJR-5R TaxID=3093923 RepID=UPI002A75481C|nr:hypothetical protein [Chryseobacterium sp. JJR-5R]WPO81508.1 hypothetical protein SD427_12120 [Chryseobacterium sp. JJR-5R]